MQDFRKLKVWEKSHELTKLVYKITSDYPSEELFGLTSQLRRSASSVPTNIAEGANRGTDQEFNRFINISIGSITETEYLAFLSFELNYISESEKNMIVEKSIEVRKMLIILRKTLVVKKVRSSKPEAHS